MGVLLGWRNPGHGEWPSQAPGVEEEERGVWKQCETRTKEKRGRMKREEALTRSGESWEKRVDAWGFCQAVSLYQGYSIEMKCDDELRWMKRIQDELKK